ncbi:MAG: methionyl-tRNA formyltransferase [Lysobacterales bacterium]|jgi:methionyl-tRNA formyltransferase
MQDLTGQKKLRVAFAGTPAFSVPVLEAMIDHGLAPVAVFTQPDRPAGRGRTLHASPVKQLATRHDIPVFQPENLSGTEIQTTLASMHLDLIVVVAYGLILPARVLAIPRFGCWNIHASLLPRWRGAAPIQRAIEAGDSQTGICMMQMDAGLDTGSVFMRSITAISADDTGGSLHDRLASIGALALLDCLQKLLVGKLPAAVEQDSTLTTYATKLNKSEAQLDWNRTAVVLERQIRAFNPWPVCWFDLNGDRIRVWKAEIVDNGSPCQIGDILAANAKGIDICTSQGILRLTEVQRAGGNRMPVDQFLNAHPVSIDR